MDKYWYKSKKKIAAVSVAAAIWIIVFISRFSYVESSCKLLLSVCDACSSTGLIFLFWGVVLFASAKGALDGLFYISRNVARLFQREGTMPYMSYYDYINSRDHRPTMYKTFFIIGGILFGLSLIFYVLFTLITA